MFEFNINDHKYKKIHFIGIGGVSMSGIAELLNHYGYDISGSDREGSDSIDKLIEKGVKVDIGQKASNIKDPDLIVYTDAILDDNEELMKARELKDVPVVSRGVFLGALMRNYNYSIGVSGSHGKSTTTSMISKILLDADVDPSILLGGKLDQISGNVHCGNSEYMVTEACEYKANILNYYPSMAIILNIDEDHLDFYKDINHIIATFIGYMKNLNENSKAIINIDDENCKQLLDHIKGDIITFAINNPDALYRVTDLDFNENGNPSFILESERLKEPVKFDLDIIGRYNVYNAVAAIIACYECHIDIDKIKESIHGYHNLHRRMETLGFYKGAEIKTDYGHHPTEIRNTLAALNEHKKRRLVCIFQPHTYSRTKALLDDFANSFYDCDEVIVTEIYAAREKMDDSIHSTDLVAKLVENGVDAKYYKTFEEAKDYIRKSVKEDDMVITTGCGNPDVLAKMIVED